MNYEKRIEVLRQQMQKLGADAFITTPDANWQYLAGISRLGGGNTKNRQHGIEYACLVVLTSEVVAFAPELNLMGRQSELAEAQLIALPEGDVSGSTICAYLHKLGLKGKRVGVTQDLSAALVLMLQNEMSAQVFDMNKTIFDMRAVKDEDELSLMRNGAEITDKIYNALCVDIVRPGVSGRDIERAIDCLLEEFGASKNSFPSDANIQGPLAPPMMGCPHHTVEKGYVIGFDFGVVYKNYCTDFGRTIFVGEPTKRHMEIYDLVYAAHMAGCNELKVGKSCGEAADEAARKIFRNADCEQQFIHKLGHSIGMDVHELPFLAKGEKELFRLNEIYAIEPSLYFPAHSFIRLEDEVLVTPDGYEILSKIPHMPVIIE